MKQSNVSIKNLTVVDYITDEETVVAIEYFPIDGLSCIQYNRNNFFFIKKSDRLQYNGTENGSIFFTRIS